MRRARRLAALVAGAVVAATLGSASRALAATITVDTNGSPGPDGRCSLLEAIQAANTDQPVDTCGSGNGADVIVLSGDTYPFYGPLEIATPLEIQGAGMTSTTLFGSDNAGPSIAGISPTDCSGSAAIYIAVANDRVRLTSFTLEQTPGASSKGICHLAAGVTMTGVRVTGFREGGVFCPANAASPPSLAMTQSQIDNNHSSGDGAGIFFSGNGFDVRQSAFLNNSSERSGGGLYYVGQGDNRLVDTIVTGNTGLRGGGIFLSPAAPSYFELDGTTITDNHAISSGGGLFVGSNADPLPVHYSTITNNAADGDNQQANLNSDYPSYGSYITCYESSLIDVSGAEWTTLPANADGTCRYSPFPTTHGADGGETESGANRGLTTAGPDAGTLDGPGASAAPGSLSAGGGCSLGSSASAAAGGAASAAMTAVFLLVARRRQRRGRRERPSR
jgi:Right handed beta helix region